MRPTQAVMKDVNPYGWHSEVSVEIPNGDTTTLRDLYLTLRTNRRFQADSLGVTILLIDPDSCHYSEEVYFALKHQRSPAALRAIHELPYRRWAKFDRIGTYTLRIAPLKEQQGIEAVGINIIKSEENAAREQE